MTRLTYPVVLRPDDNDTFLVSFPDFPEAHTFGDTKEEALARAKDALATAIDAYIADRREIPAPSPIRSKHLTVTLPLLMGTKVALYSAMREKGVGKAELARRLDVHLPQVDRLLDVRHSSQLGQLESAFDAIGKRIEVVVFSEAEIGKIREHGRKSNSDRSSSRSTARRRAQETHARA
jgi:antitoxin HicB